MNVTDCWPLVTVILVVAFWSFVIGHCVGFLRGAMTREYEFKQLKQEMEKLKGGDK